jgi:hypothetical protein
MKEGGDDSELKKAKARAKKAKNVSEWYKKIVAQEKSRKDRQKAKAEKRAVERKMRGPTDKQGMRLHIRKTWKHYNELWGKRVRAQARAQRDARREEKKQRKLAEAETKRKYTRRKPTTPKQIERAAQSKARAKARRQETVLRRREKRKANTAARNIRRKEKKAARREKIAAQRIVMREQRRKARQRVGAARKARIQKRLTRIKAKIKARRISRWQKRKAGKRRALEHNREVAKQARIRKQQRDNLRSKMMAKARREDRKARNVARRMMYNAQRDAAKQVTQSQVKGRQGIISDALKRIGTLMGAVINVGFVGREGAARHADSQLTVAGVAYRNEYGVGVPERPFMRITIANSKENWFKMAAQIAKNQYKGVERVSTALRRLGLKMVQNHKATIRKGVPPPNSPRTIARKGSSKTLIDTSQMINSIRAEVVLPDGTQELIA